MKLPLATLLALGLALAAGIRAFDAIEKRVSLVEWTLRWHGLDQLEPAVARAPTADDQRRMDDAEWYGHTHH